MFGNFNNQLDDLLQRVGQKLQISKSQRDLAENRYLSVSTWLSKDETYFNGKDILIYPHP
ncbi:hypothetical protein [Bacillus sp. CHD6a]|uniref:hypothetical protein n=1 Tax=Bacillus sp. CHD6a TaxID=1643452 RepID=UPI000A5E6BD7|nr:hypothetical protein [Bacillus sp. CHD6a]